jgi:hypothetical protein
MAKYTVVKRGDIKQAGPNWLKLTLILKGDDGEKKVVVWNKSADAAGKYQAGAIVEGEIKYRESKDPQYEGENVFTGKVISAGEAPAPAQTNGNPTPAGFVDDKDARIVRESATKSAAAFLNGSKAEIGDYWAMVRQIQIYSATGKIVKMSTKIQHEAILAMFMKKDGEKLAPDVEAAEQAVFDFAGVINIRALTFSEAAAFLGSMTPPTPE